MSVYEEKNNPPVWFIIVGIIVFSVAAVFVMLAPTKKYSQKNQYYLKGAQGSLIENTARIDPSAYIYGNSGNHV